MGGLIVSLFAAFLLGTAYFNGYSSAHFEISTECQRLGSFYVGEKTFKCELKPVSEKTSP